MPLHNTSHPGLQGFRFAITAPIVRHIKVIGLVAFVAALASIVSPMGRVYAQTAPFRNYPFERGGFPQVSVPPDAVSLVPNNGGRTGKVWLVEANEGVIIFGKIDGAPPKWARFPLEMSASAHVDVWLASDAIVKMPEIGWGNQFGYTNCAAYDLPTASSAAESCSAWSTRQISYRTQLKRLFVRQWQMAPNVSREVFCTDAYRRVLDVADDSERPLIDKLYREGHPYLEASDSTGFSMFEIYVKWADFPPASSLNLSQVYIAVDVFDVNGASASTTPRRVDSDPNTFSRIALGKPHVSRVTLCNYPLTFTDVFHDEWPGWYFPSQDAFITDLFVLTNELGGYRYGPAGLSPIPVWVHHFSKNLGAGDGICGPQLRYVAGTKAYDLVATIDEQALATHRLPDGGVLLRSGPTVSTLSPFGAGQCGSCLNAQASVYYLNPTTGVVPSLSVSFVVNEPKCVDGDIQFSSDWKTVTVYTAESGKIGEKPRWSSKRYCLSGTKYDECGSGPPGAPPSPRQVILKTYRRLQH